jgi:hypothetical protein
MEDLGKWKICSTFVPYCVTDERKVPTLQAYQEFIQSVEDNHSLLGSITTGDETCCFHYYPQTKKRTKTWNCARQTLQYTKNSIPQVKVMLVTFFNS